MYPATDAGLGPRPAKTLVLGYVLVIVLGALLLSLPWSQTGKVDVGFADALFTSTSAVCVTGLVTVGTETAWSGFGQLVIMILFQLGGLGIMTFSTFLLLSFGGRLSANAREATGDPLGAGSGPRLWPTIRAVFLITVCCELLGALLLYATWSFGGNRFCGPAERIWHALFHSVSAFCNAGFSTRNSSLEQFSGSYATNLIMMFLIITGGIGFVVIIDLKRRLLGQKGNPLRRLTAHSKLVLSVSTVLILAGALLIFCSEYHNPATLGRMSTGRKIMASLFQSVTARTAGFNTISQKGLSVSGMLVTIFLMVIGASPCGTGGGIKTTTLGIMLATAWSRLRGKQEVECFGRTVPREAVTRAFSLVVLSTGLMSLFLLAALATHGMSNARGDFLPGAFEIASAFATVGLSADVTGNLQVHGKLLISLLMLIGRVGPLSVAVALSRMRRRQLVKVPDAEVLVG